MVEIIPKPTKEKIPLWQIILFYLSISLIVVMIISYFVIDYFQKQAENNLQSLEKAIAERTNKDLEEEVVGYKRKIEDFSYLLSQHRKTSKFFSFFEKLIHPRVWFSGFSLSLKDFRVTVSGTAESFRILGQQLIIFQKNPLIKKTELSGISIGPEGKIHFTFNLFLNPIVFK